MIVEKISVRKRQTIDIDMSKSISVNDRIVSLRSQTSRRIFVLLEEIFENAQEIENVWDIKSQEQLLYWTKRHFENVLSMLKTLRESYDVDMKLANLYDIQKRRAQKTLKTIIKAQKQIRIARNALIIVQKNVIMFQIEVDDLTKRLDNQKDVNRLRESVSHSSSSSLEDWQDFSASSDINQIMNKRSTKHFDLDKFTDDSNNDVLK